MKHKPETERRGIGMLEKDLLQHAAGPVSRHIPL